MGSPPANPNHLRAHLEEEEALFKTIRNSYKTQDSNEMNIFFLEKDEVGISHLSA